MKKDAYYFPHFCNARHDRKLKRVQKELGIEGYGIYFMLLETLREQDEFKYPIEDIDLLADEFGTSEQKVRTVVTNYKLFSLDKAENFFSIKLLEYLKPYLTMKEQRRQAGLKSGEARRKKALSNDRSTTVQRKMNENEQSKVKKSKVNNTLEKEFDSFWELYQKKEDRKKCFAKWKTLNVKDKELIFLTVSAYVNSTQDRQYRKNPLTWLNGECWNNEIVSQKQTSTFIECDLPEI